MGVLEFFDILVFNSLMTSLRNLNVTHQYGDVAQLVRASSLYLEGHRFNSCRPYTSCVSWFGSSTTPGRRLTTHGPRKYYLSVAFRLFVRNKYPVGSLTLQVPLRGCGSDLVAQLVEQRPFKAWVLGSNPSGITRVRRIKCLHPLGGANGRLAQLV